MASTEVIETAIFRQEMVFMVTTSRASLLSLGVLVASLAAPSSVAEEWQDKAAKLAAYADRQIALLTPNEKARVAPQMAIARCVVRDYVKATEWLRELDAEKRRVVVGVLANLEIGLGRDVTWLRESLLVEKHHLCVLTLRAHLTRHQYLEATAQAEAISAMPLRDDLFGEVAVGYAQGYMNDEAYATIARIADKSKRDELQDQVDRILIAKRPVYWEDFFQRGTATRSYFYDFGVQFGLYDLQLIADRAQFHKLLSEATKDLEKLQFCGMYGAQCYSRRQSDEVSLAIQEGLAIIEKMTVRERDRNQWALKLAHLAALIGKPELADRAAATVRMPALADPLYIGVLIKLGRTDEACRIVSEYGDTRNLLCDSFGGFGIEEWTADRFIEICSRLPHARLRVSAACGAIGRLQFSVSDTD